MNGGPRYWNEETQRWEDTDGTATVSPPTLPDQPPPRPMTPPSAPPVAPPWYDPERSTTPHGTTTTPPPTPTPPPDTGTWQFSPPPDTPPTRPRTRGTSRRLAVSVIIGAAALGVAVSLVLTLVIGDGKGKQKPTGAHGTTTASAPPSTSSSPQSGSAGPPDTTPTSTSTPTGTATAPFSGSARPPTGYESYPDDAGFRIARPKGWSRTTVASVFGIKVVNYRSPDRRHRLQIYQVEESSPDASFDLFLSDQTVKPRGFQSLSRENLDTAGFTGTRLEWSATRIKGEPDVGTWHVYDERFVAPDGNIYAIAAYGPAADGNGTDDLQRLTTALTWFCPKGAACGTPQD
ncbi:hypothetical protein [Streptomyces sp. YIM S03343]